MFMLHVHFVNFKFVGFYACNSYYTLARDEFFLFAKGRDLMTLL
jgi:hypothetical protein